MIAVSYVIVTAAAVVLWGVLSSRFPRFGLFANGAGAIYLGQSVVRGEFPLGFGWTVLGFLTIAFALLAAVAGVLERRQRTSVERLPRALARN